MRLKRILRTSMALEINLNAKRKQDDGQKLRKRATASSLSEWKLKRHSATKSPGSHERD